MARGGGKGDTINAEGPCGVERHSLFEESSRLVQHLHHHSRFLP